MAEVLLPWKRPEDEVMCDKPLRQSEFPAWASNKEYVGYYSPSNTFLGALVYLLVSFSLVLFQVTANSTQNTG